jgi:hypothetical protein
MWSAQVSGARQLTMTQKTEHKIARNDAFTPVWKPEADPPRSRTMAHKLARQVPELSHKVSEKSQ